MTTLTQAELTQLGYRVVDGKAVKIAEQSKAPAPVARSPYRSKWDEARFEYWDAMKRHGLVRDVRYEGIRLRLATGAWYKPDLMVTHNDGRIELEEVKGFFREAAKVRWRVAVEQFPMFSFRLTTKRNGAFITLELHHAA